MGNKTQTQTKDPNTFKKTVRYFYPIGVCKIDGIKIEYEDIVAQIADIKCANFEYAMLFTGPKKYEQCITCDIEDTIIMLIIKSDKSFDKKKMIDKLAKCDQFNWVKRKFDMEEYIKMKEVCVIFNKPMPHGMTVRYELYLFLKNYDYIEPPKYVEPSAPPPY